MAGLQESVTHSQLRYGTSQDQLTFLKLHELKKYYTDIATKIYDISDLSLGSRESY